MTLVEVIVVFLTGIVGSLIGAAAGGGGGAIIFAGLIWTGLPTHVAIGTLKIGDIGHHLITVWDFCKKKMVVKKLVAYTMFIGAFGAFIGSAIVISLKEEIVNRVIATVLLIALIIIAYSKNVGLKKRSGSWLWVPAYFLISVQSGFFGAGGGLLSVIALCYWRGLRFLEAIGTHKVGAFPATIVSVIVFGVAGFINYKLVIPLLAGNILGGHIGSRIALKKGDKWVRSFVIAAIVFTIITLLFFR